MPVLSEKENFMRVINKEMPEYIPTYNLMWGFNMPPFLMGMMFPEGGVGKNMFGVESVQDSGGLLPPMSKTSDFIMDDITKWRDIIKIPDFDFTDSMWADAGKESQDFRDPTQPFGGGVSMGFFQPLVSFMGFTEGLSAYYEEPDEVKALYEYLSDWSVDMTKKFLYYFKPEFGFMADDIAHERNPFLSLPMFQDLIAPYWKRFYDIFVEAGLPCGHHNCGHFELYLEDLVNMGVSFWDPVQPSNDEMAIKAKYGRNLALCGGPESRFWNDETTEEQVRAEVTDYIMKMSAGGGFAMFAFMIDDDAPPPPPPDPDAEPAPMMFNFSEAELARMGWISDVFKSLRYEVYK